MPKGEPKTEDEAQEMKKFLENGASVQLEKRKRVPAVAGKLSAGAPLPLAVAGVGGLLADVVPRSEEDGKVVESRLLIELTFQPFQVLPNYTVHVFVNNPGANARTPVDDPSFVGAVSFLCHAELRDGEPVCVPHGDEKPSVYRLPVTEDALGGARRAAAGAALPVTLVPVPYDGRKPIQPVDVKASVVLARSEFVPASA